MSGDVELHAEVDRLVGMAMRAVLRDRPWIPGVGTPSWWAADDAAKMAGLLVLAEAWVVHDPERAVRERLKQMSIDLSAATDWAAAAQRPSHVELQRRRTEPGPMWSWSAAS